MTDAATKSSPTSTKSSSNPSSPSAGGPPNAAFPAQTHASTAARAGRPFEHDDDLTDTSDDEHTNTNTNTNTMMATESTDGAGLMGGTASPTSTDIPTIPPPTEPHSPSVGMPADNPPPVPTSQSAEQREAQTAEAVAALMGGGPKDTNGTTSTTGSKCEVIDPQHVGEGRSKYTTYCVLVANLSAVRRRYSDFQWLESRLSLERPGAIIPIIPHKRVRLLKTETKFTDEFVSHRRGALEEWINRILEHPELQGAPSLVSFMRQEDTLFAAAKKANDFPSPTEMSSLSLSEGGDNGNARNGDAAEDGEDYGLDDGANNASSGGKPRFGRIRKLFAKAAIKSGVELAKVDDEETFVDIEKYTAELETNIAVLIKQSAILSKTTKQQQESTQEMAKAFSSLSENTYPTPDLAAAGRLATVLNNAGKGFLSLAATFDEKAASEEDQIETALADFERDVQSLRAALQKRKESQYNLTKKLSRITTIESRLDRMKEVAVNSADENSMPTIKAKQGEALEAKEAAEVARKDLEIVSQRIVREVERFRIVVDAKMRHIIAEMGGVAVRFDDRLTDGWGTILAGTQPNTEPLFDAV